MTTLCYTLGDALKLQIHALQNEVDEANFKPPFSSKPDEPPVFPRGKDSFHANRLTHSDGCE